MTAFRNNHVSISFRRLNKLHMHRPHGPNVLLDHRIDSATSLSQVSLQPTDKANVIRSVYEDFDIHQFEQPRLGKDQNAFHDNDGFWCYSSRLVESSVRLEVINWQLHRFTGF